MTKRLGISHICLKSFHLPLDSDAATCAAAARKARELGVEIWGGGVITMRTEPEVRQAFAYAKAAGMRCIVGVPLPPVLDLVERQIEATGIRVAIHNHGPGDRVYPRPQDALERIRDRHPGLGLCVDIGHTQRVGINPAEAIRQAGSRVLDVHMKDVSAASPEGRTVEIGRGVIDIPEVLRALQQIRYQGFLSFEHEKDAADPLPGLAESVGYIRGVVRMMS